MNLLCYFDAADTSCSMQSRPTFIVSYVHPSPMINQKFNKIITFVDASLPNTNNG